MRRASLSAPAAPPTIDERIAELERELSALRARQRARLVAVIASVIPPGVVFSARELFEHRAVNPDLAVALADAGIETARQLGKRLRQLCGVGLDRVGVDHGGALWTVTR